MAALLAAGTASASAQGSEEFIPGVNVSRFSIERNGKYLTVEMLLDLTELDVTSNRAVLLTPSLVNGTDSLALPSVGIYGRRRYYYYERNGIGPISGEDESSFRAYNRPDTIEYSRSVVYEDWMDGAMLNFHRRDWGCCQEMVAEYVDNIGRHSEAFFPALIFVSPGADTVKTRYLSGSAFIDYPVDKTEIYPKYRKNPSELEKIQASIDSVRVDADITIQSVWFKGFASPESPYEHNRYLSIGRAASLKEYVRNLYDFDESLITAEYEPEDWAGLRRYVETYESPNRDKILEVIDSDMKPDPKEAKIKRMWPEDYRYLLRNCYPALRHTDYRIEYSIRTYTDVEEIKRILVQRPQNLSLNEFYMVADTYEPGTPEFTEVFETAVRMFPNDEVANLNAGNAAMRHGDNATARRYLDKAGESAEAVYARGALAVREGDYTNAVTFLEKASEMGLNQADEILRELKNRGFID